MALKQIYIDLVNGTLIENIAENKRCSAEIKTQIFKFKIKFKKKHFRNYLFGYSRHTQCGHLYTDNNMHI